MDIETCIRNYLTSGEFNHEAYHPARDFLSGLLDITIVKPVIEFFTGTDLITGERLTEAQKYQKMAGAIVDMFTFGQGLAAMKGAGLVGKELCKAFGKTMLVEVASSASAYTVGYGVEAMGLPPQIAWMLGAATGCIVSTAGMNLVFRNPQTGVVRECSLEEITSLEKLDASEIDITKLGKEVPADDLELYMRYQKEGSIEHFTDSEKKTISRIETMGITGDECEEILRARGKEVTRPPIEEPEAVLPPRNESEGKGVSTNSNRYCLSGEEHYEAYKEMFGAENVEWTSRDTLSSADRLRIQGWAYPPTDELYLKYKNVYQNDLYFYQATGKVNWPNYDGFVPESINYETLREGTRFMRIGESSGEFLGTTTDPFEKRSLAPFSDPSITSTPIKYYELLDDTEFLTGDIAPWFDFDGGGKQFLAYKPDGNRYTIQELLDADILKDITEQVKKGEIIIDASIK